MEETHYYASSRGNRGGDTNFTNEKITPKSTAIGILGGAGIYAATMIIASMVITALGFLVPNSGVWFMVLTLALFLSVGLDKKKGRAWVGLYDPNQVDKARRLTHYMVGILGALILLLQVFNVWPNWPNWMTTVRASRDGVTTTMVNLNHRVDCDYQWAAGNDRACSAGFPETSFTEVPVILVILRVLAVPVLVLALYEPLAIVRWAAKIEVLMPKYRESGFAPIDPGSIEGVHGGIMNAATKRVVKTENNDEVPERVNLPSVPVSNRAGGRVSIGGRKL